MIDLNQANFEQEVLDASTPVVVAFLSSRSELCQAVAPALESVAEHGSMPMKVARVNVEGQGELVDQYGVRGLPTLLIFNRGRLHDQIIGRTTERELRQRLETLK